MSYFATAHATLNYLRECPDWITRLKSELAAENPDLVITDFEPLVPRAAKACGIPFISLDHQHFLRTYDLGCLPFCLRWHALYMGWIVSLFYSGQMASIVSAFFFPKLNINAPNTIQVGVFLRDSVIGSAGKNDGHALAYFNHPPPDHVVSAIQGMGVEVRLYGLGHHPRRGSVHYRKVDEAQFLEDLTTCNMLICSAGNQLIGEALYLGKPVLAVPQLRFKEQYINAHFLRKSGGGDWIDAREFSPLILKNFRAKMEQYRNRVCPDKMNGLPKTIETINQILLHRHRRSPYSMLSPSQISAIS